MRHHKVEVTTEYPCHDKCSVCGAKRLWVGTQELASGRQSRGWVLNGLWAWECRGKPAEVSEKK